MNATSLPLPVSGFATVPASAGRIVIAPRFGIAAVTATRDLSLAPFAAAADDALDAGQACCPRPSHDPLARYAAPAAPALFHVR